MMRIASMARPDTGTAVWLHHGDSVLAVGVWTERRPGHGEDAEPLLVHHAPTREGIIGVFDGSGGSGSSIVHDSPVGNGRSGAWVGARLARAGVESWFCARVEESGGFDPELLRQHVRSLLCCMRPRSRSKVVGTMRKDLPTTMAAVRYRLRGEEADCQALWAGDSRAYVLHPRGGLQTLTRDHTVETDALEQLLQDPPLTNVLYAGEDFTIDSHSLVINLPAVLICASDGFFGYVDTPAHFECHLLGTLRAAVDERDWAERLAAKVSAYTADDASLSMVAVGYPGFRALRSSFWARTEDILARYWPDRPVGELDHAAFRLWRAQKWNDYREGYERLMPPLGEDDR
jgi:serine/threonine protein phosphatase PrpC